ncbi:MAG: cysteine desulfurase family protein [Atopobiaceae bacterium]|jgi:cysteine desulfurase
MPVGGPNAPQREVYLDFAAATPVDRRVLAAMQPYWSACFYNPSAPYAPARGARDAYERARSSLARLIGARPDCVVLTAGATEANNLAFATLSEDGHVVVDAIEHESVLACAASHPRKTVLVAPDGRVDPEDIRRAIRPKTELVSVELANGEIGTIQPVRQIACIVAQERARRLAAGQDRPIWLHTDASQAAGALSVEVSSLNCDLMTLSAAKIYGPKQVGLLWAADDVRLRPLIVGGGQESGLRSGTENVAGVVGFAQALELATRMRAEEVPELRRLRNLLQRRLAEEFPWAVFSGPRQDKLRLPGLLHVSFPLLDARRLVISLERRGVYVGTGSACAASRMRSSHVLDAIGIPRQVAQGSLRITIGRPTTEEDIRYAADQISEVVSGEVRRCGLTDRQLTEAGRASYNDAVLGGSRQTGGLL